MNRGIAAAAALAVAGTVSAADSVTPAELARQIQDSKSAPFVLDVRTTEEFATGHVPGAVNIPIQGLEPRLQEVPKNRGIVVYCEKGGRSDRAATLLTKSGFRDVRAMEGSMSAWRAAGLAIETGP